MKRRRLIPVLVGLMMVFALEPVGPSAVVSESAQSASEEGFVPLFDGHTLSGWRKLTEYSGESGSWKVEDGAIVGDQYPEGEGGLLVTEEVYGDFELLAEVKADYPIDSGLFLRVQPNVLSYQVTIDYRPDGEVGAIYCPGGGGFLVHQPEGEKLWRPENFNTLRVRIQGQPAQIRVWLNGRELVDFVDQLTGGRPRVPEAGFVGIQVHPGSGWGKGNKVYFRKILIKTLDEVPTGPTSGIPR